DLSGHCDFVLRECVMGSTIKKAALNLLVFSVLAGSPALASTSPQCSLSQATVDPQSVIAPCTTIIDGKQASTAELGLALFVRGKGYHNTKRFDLAGQDYDAAIKLTPKNDELYVSRANIAFRGRRVREGMDFLQKALAINHYNAHALSS